MTIDRIQTKGITTQPPKPPGPSMQAGGGVVGIIIDKTHKIIEKNKHKAIDENNRIAASNHLLKLLSNLQAALLNGDYKTVVKDLTALNNIGKGTYSKNPKVNAAIIKQLEGFVGNIEKGLESLPGGLGDAIKNFFAGKTSGSAVIGLFKDYAELMAGTYAHGNQPPKQGYINAWQHMIGNLLTNSSSVSDISKVYGIKLQQYLSNITQLFGMLGKVVDKMYKAILQMEAHISQ